MLEFIFYTLTDSSEQTLQLAVTLMLCACDFCQARSLSCAVVMRLLRNRKEMV